MMLTFIKIYTRTQDGDALNLALSVSPERSIPLSLT